MFRALRRINTIAYSVIQVNVPCKPAKKLQSELYSQSLWNSENILIKCVSFYLEQLHQHGDLKVYGFWPTPCRLY